MYYVLEHIHYTSVYGYLVVYKFDCGFVYDACLAYWSQHLAIHICLCNKMKLSIIYFFAVRLAVLYYTYSIFAIMMTTLELEIDIGAPLILSHLLCPLYIQKKMCESK